MKNLKDFIIEGRTIDEIVIKDQNNNNVDATYYCYDEESLKDVCNNYKDYTGGFFLATLKNKSTWTINTLDEYKLNEYKRNDKFLESIDNDKFYSYKEIVNLLEAGETMVIVINK